MPKTCHLEFHNNESMIICHYCHMDRGIGGRNSHDSASTFFFFSPHFFCWQDHIHIYHAWASTKKNKVEDYFLLWKTGLNPKTWRIRWTANISISSSSTQIDRSYLRATHVKSILYLYCIFPQFKIWYTYRCIHLFTHTSKDKHLRIVKPIWNDDTKSYNMMHTIRSLAVIPINIRVPKSLNFL